MGLPQEGTLFLFIYDLTHRNRDGQGPWWPSSPFPFNTHFFAIAMRPLGRRTDCQATDCQATSPTTDYQVRKYAEIENYIIWRLPTTDYPKNNPTTERDPCTGKSENVSQVVAFWGALWAGVRPALFFEGCLATYLISVS